MITIPKIKFAAEYPKTSKNEAEECAQTLANQGQTAGVYQEGDCFMVATDEDLDRRIDNPLLAVYSNRNDHRLPTLALSLMDPAGYHAP
ncbi:MAG TPA: hypothetical protein V6C52_09935 [Coleofasciculaceae cyanobacterium]|jgi:hypothetical protein